MKNPATKTVRRRSELQHLAIAGAFALLIWFVWQFWQDEPPVVAMQRSLKQVRMQWVCINDHEFEALGLYGSRACMICSAESYALAEYVCPDHGEHAVRFVYEQGEQGQPIIGRAAFDDGEWKIHPEHIVCPSCGKPMHTKPTNLFKRKKQTDESSNDD